MRKHISICGGMALFMVVSAAVASTITVNNNGDSGSGNCTTSCTLREAITTAIDGDTINFQSGLASPITLTQGELLINKALTIAGPGAVSLTISANNNSRVFDIAANTTITDIAIADGAVTGGDAANNGTGAAGESVGGACVLVASGIAAELDRVAVRHCSASGGAGGSGAVGAPGSGGPMPPIIPGGMGGPGGTGGASTGAAIEVDGTLSMSDSSVVDAHAAGGTGGIGGMGGPGFAAGPGGLGGVGGQAEGGAVYAGSGASLRIVNSTIAQGSAIGGSGGTGGPGTSTGPGGSGGYATGGLLAIDGGATLADLEFSTLVNGSVTGGAGTQTGAVIANAINAGSTLNVLSSIVVGAQGNANLCYGSVTAATGSANLSEYTNNDINNPSACNSFSLNATFSQTLKPIDASATPAYMPIWKSPAIDAAANCQDLTSTIVTADQHGTKRPQGAKCDLGAIEADYIFVDGFGG